MGVRGKGEEPLAPTGHTHQPRNRGKQELTADEDLTWEQPPPKREERYDWTSIAKKLRRRPMKWAKIFEKDRSSLATAIRIKGIKALHPDKGFEVRTANNTREQPRTCAMWLRYNPEKDREKQ